MLLARYNFCLLKELKLCSTIMNNWLKHLLIVHVYKLFTDRHDLMKVADKFAERYEGKKSKFRLW